MSSKLEILEALKAFGETGTFMAKKILKSVVKDGLVEMQETVTNPAGDVAVRISAAGLAFLAELEPKAVAEAAPVFVLKSAPIPTTTRKAGAGRKSKYPFATMEVGQYFFVPDSEKCQDPTKSLTSIVAATNRKYAFEIAVTRVNRKGNVVPVLEYSRKFVVRPYHETDSEGNIVNGAGVWREK